ncbi:MAG: cell wall hydrolase [Lachnospiraceae bacterium]|nr:cell wall hydrolase [Lachnospiraceae bacterium]
MKVKSRVIFRPILLFAICFAMGMMKSSMVHASDLTPVTEVDILDVSDDGNNVIVAGDTDICLAAGAFDKESVVSLEEEEIEIEVIVTEEEETVSSNTVFAKVSDSVNVREEPNEEAQKVGKLYKNCSGTMLEQSDGWTKITSGNLIGWVSSDYLYFGEEADQKIAEVGTLKATISTDALRVRKEASENAGVYKLAKKDEKFTVVEELDGWIGVRVDDETVGYVSAEYATVEFTTEKGKTNQEIADEERAEQLKKLTKNRGAVPSSVSETALLAALIQAEAGSQPYEGQLAVGAVVMNRVRSGGYPNTVMGVITQPGQFPPATNGTVGAIVSRGAKASCVRAAEAAINGETNVGGAMHFGRVGKAVGIVIGSHVFY